MNINEQAKNKAELIAKKILAKMEKQDNFPLMAEEMVKIILEEGNLAASIRCTQALSFASSVIKSGESWSPSCESIIQGALNNYYAQSNNTGS